MTDYKDAKHRPHAVHTGEVPRNPITYGPESLKVTLDRWGPEQNLFTSMYDALQANWGDAPSRTVYNNCMCPENPAHIDSHHDPLTCQDCRTGWCKLNDDQRAYVESCFAGKTLQQVLEGVTFDFCVDGVSRAFTHQNVRTRLGAGFMQHGGRDNDWRHRPWTMPETIRRACIYFPNDEDFTKASGVPWIANKEDLTHCVTDWEPIHAYLEERDNPDADRLTLMTAIEWYLSEGRHLYAALVDAGIPWQDARRVLTIGTQTYIHDQYNYIALQGMLANRLEHIMDWEHNCVAQLMLREVKMKCPPLLSKYLGSHSDKARAAKFAGLESWPPDRKYPSPYDDCELCSHAGSMHVKYETAAKASPSQYPPQNVLPGEMVCADCARIYPPSVAPLHVFKPKDRLPRQHRPEQNPFFVLHPDSMAGGPIVWIPTNGQFPHDQVKV